MWDLKLNNSCNHRIINEPLDVKSSNSVCYATLKRPVYGNDLIVKIVDEDNLFPLNKTIIETYTFKYIYTQSIYNIYINHSDITVNSLYAMINGLNTKLVENIDFTINSNESYLYTITFLNTRNGTPDINSDVVLTYSFEGVEKPTYISYELGEDKKTLKLNINADDISEKVYPKHSYYATYYTNHENCPKCIYGTNKTNDVYIDVLGRPILTTGLELLVQKVKKILITAIESNLFDSNYGSELPNLIGKPKTVLTLLRAQSTIQDAIDRLKNQQMSNYDLLTDEEKLLKIDNFQVMPTEDPKVLKFSFEIYNLAGQNVNIGVSI